jgi:hypothetical protein
MDVGHHVDGPHPFPDGYLRLLVADYPDAGIGAEQVDGPEPVFSRFDQLPIRFGICDVGEDGDPADICRDGGCRIEIDVGQDEGRGAFLCESACHGGADPAASSGHDYDLVFELHVSEA